MLILHLPLRVFVDDGAGGEIQGQHALLVLALAIRLDHAERVRHRLGRAKLRQSE
eukprot:COSAG01_NODE_84_length_27672_cov_60.966344_5_plen_55_part_00